MTLVQSEPKKIYIWDKPVRSWQSDSSTIAYRPFTSSTTVNDQSGNWYNLTNNWAATFWTYGWVSCVRFTWSSSSNLTTSSFYNWSGSPTFSVSLWVYFNSIAEVTIWFTWNQGWTASAWLWMNSSWVLQVWWWTNDRNTWYIVVTWQWYNVVMTHKWWTVKVYVNWDLVYTWTVSFNITWWYNFVVWKALWAWWYINWYVSNLIVENFEWSSAEVATYYNQTKSNYGL